MPLHKLCFNKNADDITATEILKLLVEKCPEAVRQADNIKGRLPIHFACLRRSPEFCRLLIEAYPGSERMADSIGLLPLDCACLMNNVAVVEYLYHLYPDAINHAPSAGYPIHFAIFGLGHRDNPAAAVDVVKFLLDCDPNVLQKHQRRLSLLHYSCVREYNDSIIAAGIQVINLLYDTLPEAIDANEMAFNIHVFHHQVQTFINSQLVYSHQDRNHRLMITSNEQGQLPLHTALQNNVRLGSIKLLVKGNPPALRSPDNSGALPLHVACQHHQSARVVQYLIELDAFTLHTVDFDHNTALHYACRGVKYDTIALLLDKFDAVSVSTRDAHKKLPIDLLFESNEVFDRESTEYIESIFRLLRAYPEIVMNLGMHSKQQIASAVCASPSKNGTKRKFGLDE
jgi:ankyrin repeat protein